MFFRRRPASPAALSDEELLQRYRQQGDVRDIGELYDRHLATVFAVCRRYLRPDEEAQDAAMQLFEQLVEKLRRHEVENFAAWLQTTARNHCLMVLRARQRQTPDQGGPLILHFPDMPDVELASGRHLVNDDPDEAHSAEARLQHLEQALAELPAGQRQCLELFYLQQKCYRTIAEETGFELTQVKSHLQNGKRNLKRMLESYSSDATP